MSSTSSEHISPILSEIQHLDPGSILDVGSGLGLYGVLCRIFLDLDGKERASGGRQDRERLQIVGIEPGAARGCETLGWAYDETYREPAQAVLPRLPSDSFDLVLALGLIEHLRPDDGEQVIRELKRVGRYVILSTPKAVLPGAVGQALDAPRSQWTEQDLAALGFQKFLPHHSDWIAIFDPDIAKVAQVSRQAARARQSNRPFGRAVPSPSEISRLDELELKRGLLDIQEALREIQAAQHVTNDERLSLRHRIRSVLTRR